MGKGPKQRTPVKKGKDSPASTQKSKSVAPVDSSTGKKPASNVLLVVFLVCVWYASAIMCVTSSKKIMMISPLPNMLCTSQFISASIITAIPQLFSSDYRIKPIQSAFAGLVILVSLSYTFGFLFTNYAISIVSPSFVETIKAAEPLFSVVLGLFFFNEGTLLTTYLTLIPICGGVAIACLGNASYSLMGLLASAASNVGFSSRSVFSKRFNKLHPGAFDETTLFAHISRIGLVVLVPITLWTEWGQIQTVAQTLTSGDDNSALLDYASLLLLNGFTYSLYNLTSFIVLAKTDLITHAVLNAFRRVVSISFTVMYFKTVISTLNAGGICIAVGGVLAFGYAKSLEGKSKTK